MPCDRSASRRLPCLLLFALVGLSAAGCAGVPLAGVTDSSGGVFGGVGASKGEPRNLDEWRREAKTAGEHYRANPKSAGAALRYAEALRHTEQRTQAAAVLQQAAIHNPNDKRVLGAYGRALAETGNLPQALEALGHAHTPDQPDWRILSAQGVVLDRMGRHDEARRHYDAALKIVPDEPSVLSNLGLSYVLSKELRLAEETLRKASAKASGERRVRQNLALVVGLQGRFEEAEAIARADLPPKEAAENIAYLRQMLADKQDRPRGKPAARKTAASLRGA